MPDESPPVHPSEARVITPAIPMSNPLSYPDLTPPHNFQGMSRTMSPYSKPWSQDMSTNIIIIKSLFPRHSDSELCSPGWLATARICITRLDPTSVQAGWPNSNHVIANAPHIWDITQPVTPNPKPARAASTERIYKVRRKDAWEYD